MTAVVEVIRELRSTDNRELFERAVRDLAESENDFFTPGLLVLVLALVAANTHLLLQVNGYTAHIITPVVGMVKAGMAGFALFVGAEIARLASTSAVERWDAEEEVPADG